MKIKRIFAGLTALLMVGCMAASCGHPAKTTEDADEKERKELFSATVMTIDGEPVTYEKYRYYFYNVAKSISDGKNSYFTERPEALQEVRDEVEDLLRSEYAVRKIAARYGISISDDDWAEVDSYLQQVDYYYRTSLGISFKDDLEANYATYEFYRDLQGYQTFLSGGLYDYLYDRDNHAVDFSDEAVDAYLATQEAAQHVLLTTDNYDTLDEAKTVAQGLRALLTGCQDAAESIRQAQTAAAVTEAVRSMREAFEKAEEDCSLLSGFSPFIDRLKAIGEEAGAEDGTHPAFAYLKQQSDRITGGETAVTYVKEFAQKIAENGVEEDSLKGCEDALTLYEESVQNEIDAYLYGGSATSYPSGEKLDVLFALRFVRAVLRNETISFAYTTFDRAFQEAVRLYGEDREDPEYGVYFTLGKTDEDFEKAYVALSVGEISQPVQTTYGIHLIRKIEPDRAFFLDKLYEAYVVDDLISEVYDAQTIVREEIYDTITPETLR